jgi:hypothetical protein
MMRGRNTIKRSLQPQGNLLRIFALNLRLKVRPALKAMEYETAELQQAMPHENVTAQCRPLIDNVFKETQAYYRVEELVLKAARDNSSAELNAVTPMEDAIISDQNKAVTALEADKSCKGF